MTAELWRTGHGTSTFLESADHVTWCDSGTTTELGPPAQAFADERFSREYLGRGCPFHVAAIVSLVSTILGVMSARSLRRQRLARAGAGGRDLLSHHYAWMSYSYVGLVAATVAEIATRVPAFHPARGQGAAFGAVVGVSAVVVFIIGSRMIQRRMSASLAPFRR